MTMKKCEKCGAMNEPDVRFCVGCGNKFDSNGSETQVHSNTVAVSSGGRQRPMTNNNVYADPQPTVVREQIEHNSNPLEVIWIGFLMSERMVLIGATIGLIASIMVMMDEGTSFLSAAVYFAAMIASFIVLYLSINVSATKKIELARWQIAIGAFFMLSLNSTYYLLGTAMGTTIHSFDMSDFSQLLTLTSSALILIGAIKLQGELLQKVSCDEVKRNI